MHPHTTVTVISNIWHAMIRSEDESSLVIIEEFPEELLRSHYYIVNYLDVPHVFLNMYPLSNCTLFFAPPYRTHTWMRSIGMSCSIQAEKMKEKYSLFTANLIVKLTVWGCVSQKKLKLIKDPSIQFSSVFKGCKPRWPGLLWLLCLTFGKILIILVIRPCFDFARCSSPREHGQDVRRPKRKGVGWLIEYWIEINLHYDNNQ